MVKKLIEIIVLLKDIKRILGNIYMMFLQDLGRFEYHYYPYYPTTEDDSDTTKGKYPYWKWTRND